MPLPGAKRILAMKIALAQITIAGPVGRLGMSELIMVPAIPDSAPNKAEREIIIHNVFVH